MKNKAFIVLLLLVSSSAFSELYKSNVKASYYADKYHGRKTASGEVFNMYDMTCAHKTLPFGTILHVTNLKNNKSVDVRVNDRGPFVQGREIDVSKSAAVKLDMVGAGTASVKIEIVGKGDNTSLAQAPKKSHPANTVKTVKTLPSSPASFWDVQVGSFSSHENANRLAQNLLKKGFENVYFQKTPSVIRVVLKKVPDSNLEHTELMLRKSGYDEYIIKKNS